MFCAWPDLLGISNPSWSRRGSTPLQLLRNLQTPQRTCPWVLTWAYDPAVNWWDAFAGQCIPHHTCLSLCPAKPKEIQSLMKEKIQCAPWFEGFLLSQCCFCDLFLWHRVIIVLKAKGNLEICIALSKSSEAKRIQMEQNSFPISLRPTSKMVRTLECLSWVELALSEPDGIKMDWCEGNSVSPPTVGMIAAYLKHTLWRPHADPLPHVQQSPTLQLVIIMLEKVGFKEGSADGRSSCTAGSGRLRSKDLAELGQQPLETCKPLLIW